MKISGLLKPLISYSTQILVIGISIVSWAIKNCWSPWDMRETDVFSSKTVAVIEFFLGRDVSNVY